MITVLFFAQLREQLQCEKLSFEAAQPLSVSQLRMQLIKQYPHWAEYLNSGKLLFSVNQTLAKASQQINSGDEVAFFPPVTGG